jgi:hypothetical protein
MSPTTDIKALSLPFSLGEQTFDSRRLPESKSRNIELARILYRGDFLMTYMRLM